MNAQIPNATGYTSTVHRQFSTAAEQPQVSPLSAQARGAWIFMRDEGGFYTPGELGSLLLPELDPRRAAMTTHRWLAALKNRQHVAVNPLALKHKSYGVTSRCFPIPGESLEPANT
jgi:hypothetical protein